jgi:cytochrome c oxidase subunit 2
MRLTAKISSLTAALWAGLSASAAQAQDSFEGLPVIGRPIDQGMGFQPAATEAGPRSAMARRDDPGDHHAITLFVTALLAW